MPRHRKTYQKTREFEVESDIHGRERNLIYLYAGEFSHGMEENLKRKLDGEVIEQNTPQAFPNQFGFILFALEIRVISTTGVRFGFCTDAKMGSSRRGRRARNGQRKRFRATRRRALKSQSEGSFLHRCQTIYFLSS